VPCSDGERHSDRPTTGQGSHARETLHLPGARYCLDYAN
jgi:hypothetical protein